MHLSQFATTKHHEELNREARTILTPTYLLRCIIIIGFRGTGKDLSCTLGSVIIAEGKRFKVCKVTVQPVSSVSKNKN